uniref:G-protein coupled receptors family 1 profile domain-containing protein n=1 Tax=Podarcis muralis TaxID=64176 RepID=A0A670KCB1_PODMU
FPDTSTSIALFPYYQYSPAVAAIFIMAYLIVFLSCMAGNALVCMVVVNNERMRTVTNFFILNLAISDLLVGIFCVPPTLMDNLITGEGHSMREVGKLGFQKWHAVACQGTSLGKLV